MAVVDESITINRPVEEVFSFLVDPDNALLVNSSIVEMRSDPPGKGARAHATLRVLGRTFDVELETAEYDENERVVLRTITAPMAVEATYTYEAVSGGTRFTIHQEIEDVPGFWGNLAIPVVTKMYTHKVRADMKSTKDLLESQS
jgi:uncharacterized protein YndB with AHSA1/START domain